VLLGGGARAALSGRAGRLHPLLANQDLTAAEVRLLILPIGRRPSCDTRRSPSATPDVILIDRSPAPNMLTVARWWPPTCADSQKVSTLR
jgi:hypothetical protein